MSRNSLLISAVYRRKCIWDHNSKDHHNHFVLNRVWNEIAEELKTTRNEARKKWKNLRDRFRVELRKYSKPPSEDGVKNEDKTDESEVEESSWPHFEALQFLKDQFTHRENKNDTIMIEPRAESSNSVPDPSALVPEQTLFEGSPQTTSPQVSTDAEVPDKNKKPRYSIGKRSYDPANDSSSDMLFFESLLPHITKLSDQHKMLMMMEIQQCVYRHVYGGVHSLSSGTFPGAMAVSACSDVKEQRSLE